MTQETSQRKGGSFFWPALAAAVLAVGATAVWWTTPPRARGSGTDFQALWAKPSEVPGWEISPQPVATTQEMKRAVSELLNYDAGAFVVYSSGELRVSIYAAYWEPGKMSQRLVASHTPDVCWVANGWHCQSRGEYQFALQDARVLSLEQRVFRPGAGPDEHVVFCHLVNGRPANLTGEAGAAWYGLVADLMRHGLHLRREQLFLRISSNRPVQEFMRVKPVEIFMRNLAASAFVGGSDV